jgi:hypothetical protein
MHERNDMPAGLVSAHGYSGLVVGNPGGNRQRRTGRIVRNSETAILLVVGETSPLHSSTVNE